MNRDIFKLVNSCHAALGDLLPEHRTKHSEILRKVLERDFPANSAQLKERIILAASDGVLDVRELFDLVVSISEIRRALDEGITMGRGFLLLGDVIEERLGLVAVCYHPQGRGGCPVTPCWESCEKCPQGSGRFVPIVFYQECERVQEKIEGERL